MIDIFSISQIIINNGQKYIRQIGRIAIFQTKVFILEDYHKFLTELFQNLDGEKALQKLQQLSKNPYIQIKDFKTSSSLDLEKIKPIQYNEPESSPLVNSLWHYKMNGMDKFHTLSNENNQLSIDNQKLSDDEVSFILDSLNQGNAILKYPDLEKSDTFSSIFEDVLKKDDPNHHSIKTQTEVSDPESALQHLDTLVNAGHLHPSVAQTLRQHIFQDPVTGLGNKYAYEQFKLKNKPGVHVSMDMNGLKHLNDTYGHEAGDKAISAFGRAIRESTDEIGNQHSKAWRTGGDEAFAHFNTPEHAYEFSRRLTSKLDAIPPINGTHKLSTSIGIGSDPESADKAMYTAKSKKFKPEGIKLDPHGAIDSRNSELAFPVGQIPSFVHSDLKPNK